MTELLVVTGTFSTVWLVTWLVCSLLLVAAYPMLRRQLFRSHPADASALLLLLLAFPVLLSLVSTALLFLPGAEASLVSEHCHENCQIHTPLIQSPAVAALGLLLGGALLALLAAGLVFHLRVARRLMNRLGSLAAPGQYYWLLEDDAPLVFTVGWWKNRIYLTDGLLKRCDEEDVAIILSHEKEHARRLDNMRLLLARLFLLVLPRGLAGRLYGDLHVLTESACDLAAARQAGNLRVADTLLKVQRLAPRQFSYCDASITSAFNGAEVERRIQTLLADREPERSPFFGPRTVALALLGCSLLLVDPLHHGVELLLSLSGG